MKLLAFLVIVLFVAFVSTSEFKCDPEERYLANNCNHCKCLKGMLMCTRLACPSPESKKMEKCVIGTTSKRDCNDCWCEAPYGTVCTNKKCVYA